MSISTKNQRSGLKIPFPLRELSILTFGATVIGLLVYQNVSLSADLLGPMTYGIRGDCPPSSSFEISETSTTTAEDKYAMALEESLGFFDNIPQDDWEVMRNITLRRVNNERKSNPLFDSHRPEAWYQKNWDPDFSCRHDTKVGMGDGGKWVCDPQRLIPQSKRRMEDYKEEGRLTNQTTGKEIKTGCLVYSVGSNGDFRFEKGLLDIVGEACEIHTFDFTNWAGRVPKGRNNIFFHNWGLKPSYVETKEARSNGFGQMKIDNKPFKTFQETIKELGHEGRPIDIFKIDCEGCEWATYKDWINADLRQILVEVHRVPLIAQDFFSDLQKAGYVTFHKEPNIMWGSDCIEYAMLKLSTKYVEDRLAAGGGGGGAKVLRMK